jgi:hypothetical protein
MIQGSLAMKRQVVHWSDCQGFRRLIPPAFLEDDFAKYIKI